MSIITKTASNGITVTLDTDKKDEYRANYITLVKDGKILVEGSEFVSEERWISPYNPPAGTAALIKGCDIVQPVGQMTADLISSALVEYNNHPDIRLPRERRELKMAISMAYDKFDYLREQDYKEDIGFHQSAPVESEISAAKHALKCFDAAHPELAAEIAKKEAEKTARQIQSALNA